MESPAQQFYRTFSVPMQANMDTPISSVDQLIAQMKQRALMYGGGQALTGGQQPVGTQGILDRPPRGQAPGTLQMPQGGRSYPTAPQGFSPPPQSQGRAFQAVGTAGGTPPPRPTPYGLQMAATHTQLPQQVMDRFPDLVSIAQGSTPPTNPGGQVPGGGSAGKPTPSSPPAEQPASAGPDLAALKAAAEQAQKAYAAAMAKSRKPTA